MIVTGFGVAAGSDVHVPVMTAAKEMASESADDGEEKTEGQTSCVDNHKALLKSVSSLKRQMATQASTNRISKSEVRNSKQIRISKLEASIPNPAQILTFVRHPIQRGSDRSPIPTLPLHTTLGSIYPHGIKPHRARNCIYKLCVRL
jgi:hypothetical protein